MSLTDQLKTEEKSFYKKAMFSLLSRILVLATLPSVSFVFIIIVVENTTSIDLFFIALPIWLSLFVPVNFVWLYYLFNKMLRPLERFKDSKDLDEVLKYRRRFQISFIPVEIIITTILYAILSVLISNVQEPTASSFDVFTFNWWIVTVLLFAIPPIAVFSVPTFIAIEHYLDKILSSKISEVLGDTGVHRFTTLSVFEKNLYLALFLTGGTYLHLIQTLIPDEGMEAISSENLTTMVTISLYFAIVAFSFIFYYLLTEPRSDRSENQLFNILTNDKGVDSKIPLESIDNLGNMAQMYNIVTDRLGRVAVIIKDTTTEVFDSIKLLQDSISEVSITEENISRAMEDVTQNSIIQSEDAVQSINTVAGISTSINKNLDRIATVLQIIEDFAGQTNILALNASIEAARAGEYGRGFSVVADNVRRLADETNKNIKEIKDVVDNVSSTIGAHLDEMQTVFQSFAQKAESLSASSEEIAATVEEQTSSIFKMRDASQDLISLTNDLTSEVSELSNSKLEQNNRNSV